MKYAHLEKGTNKLLGWYSDDIHLKIPTPNVEVKEEVWQEAININANCYSNGDFIVKDFRKESEIAKEELQNKINEAQYLLDSTQFKVGDDYDKKNTPEWEELKLKRAEARQFVRANK